MTYKSSNDSQLSGARTYSIEGLSNLSTKINDCVMLFHHRKLKMVKM